MYLQKQDYIQMLWKKIYKKLNNINKKEFSLLYIYLET